MSGADEWCSGIDEMLGVCPLCGKRVWVLPDEQDGSCECPACLRKFNIVNLKEAKQ